MQTHERDHRKSQEKKHRQSQEKKPRLLYCDFSAKVCFSSFLAWKHPHLNTILWQDEYNPEVLCELPCSACSWVLWRQHFETHQTRISAMPSKLQNGMHALSGFKKALLQNPREMIRGRIFSEMIRIQARKSELQAESRSYGPKVGDTAGQTPRIRTESLRKGPRMGFRCFYRNPSLKPSWIHLMHAFLSVSLKQFSYSLRSLPNS